MRLSWIETRRDVCPYFVSTGRFFRGCEAGPQDVKTWTGHSPPPPSQGTTKRLCCDKPEINWRYYVSERSALCYIRGQGVSYVLTQSYIISHILFPLPSYPTQSTPPNGSSPRTVALDNNIRRWQLYSLAIQSERRL